MLCSKKLRKPKGRIQRISRLNTKGDSYKLNVAECTVCNLHQYACCNVCCSFASLVCTSGLWPQSRTQRGWALCLLWKQKMCICHTPGLEYEPFCRVCNGLKAWLRLYHDFQEQCAFHADCTTQVFLWHYTKNSAFSILWHNLHFYIRGLIVVTTPMEIMESLLMQLYMLRTWKPYDMHGSFLNQ